MNSTPSPNGPNGRAANGKFTAGNPGGPGNPYARKAAELRAAMYRAVSASDLRAVVKRLIAQAKQGDVQAAKLLIERCLGPAVAVDILERVETLERLLEESDA